MAIPNALKALGPVWFRFTDPEDAGKYGDQWFTYDEAKVMRMRARDLIELETDLGMPLAAVMNGFRASSVLGDTAVAWIAVREVDCARAGNFDDFNIITNLIEWSMAEPVVPPKGGEPETMPEPRESSSPTPESSQSTTSAPTASVALPTMPIAE